MKLKWLGMRLLFWSGLCLLDVRWRRIRIPAISAYGNRYIGSVVTGCDGTILNVETVCPRN